MSFSQDISLNINQDTIVSITSEQLKYSNLIFIEHEKLLIENNLLNNQLDNYKSKISLLEQTDSIRVKQIDLLNKSYISQIDKLENIINEKDKNIKILKIGGITISIGLLALLLLK